MKRNRRMRNRSRQQANASPSPPVPAAPSSPASVPEFPRIAKYAMAAVFAVCAYLSLVNLDWATLWLDEGINAYLARNWVEFGAPLVDDGRNLYTGYNGADIKADGTMHYPPLMPALTAASFALFGVGEVQARLVSVMATFAAMAVFLLILRREFPGRHGFIAVAFALACLAPMTLGYARSATYNATALFLHMLVFWAYLQFRAHKHPGYAILMSAAAIAGFYAHYLSNLLFMAALGGMHLIFRRNEFDRRAWIIIAVAAAVYSAPVLKWLLIDATVGYDKTLTMSWEIFAGSVNGNFRMLNENNMLMWSVAVWFLVWRTARFVHDRREWRTAKFVRNRRRRKLSAPPAESPWETLLADRLVHYLVFMLIGLSGLIFCAFINVAPGDIRYYHSFTPFAATFGAAAVCRAWRLRKPAGAVLCAALLLSDVAGWPFLFNFDKGNTPDWSVPKLAREYHRDYHDLHRESIAYIRENVPKDSVFYTNYHNRGWLLWYLSDHVRLCCSVNGPSNLAANLHARDYLFLSSLLAGEVTPEYLYMWGPRAPADAKVPTVLPATPQALTDKLTLPGGHVYHRVAAPEVIIGRFQNDRMSRPEPAWRSSRPDLMEARHGPAMVQFVRLYQLQQP